MNLNIGEVTKSTGLRPKTIRYYEDIGLVQPLRDTNNYRVFRETDLHKLTFLPRARALGFTIGECRTTSLRFPLRSAFLLRC